MPSIDRMQPFVPPGRLLVDQAQPPGCGIDPIRRGLRAVAVR